jgi:hypothetical protein
MREIIGVNKTRFTPVVNWFVRLFSFWFISAVFLLPLSLLIGFSVLLPGTIFKLPVLWLFIWTPFVVTFAISSIKPRQLKMPIKRQTNPKTLAVIMAIFMLIPLAAYGFQTFNESQHLKNANNEFLVINADLVAGDRVKTSLIELDRQLAKLSNSYGPISRSDKLNVVLFDSVQSLQSKTHVQQWADAYFSPKDGNPTIYLPAEQANSGENSIFTPMPGHEIGHYVIYMIVGEQYREQIPLWLNEGLVQYESYKGWEWNQILERDLIGIWLWVYNLNNSSLLNDEKFLLQNTNYPAENIDVFYAASMEFVRYISDHYGGIKDILHRVANGEECATAFQEETGKSYHEAYIEWHQAFFGK